MKKIMLLLIIIANIYANPLTSIQTFTANFTQTITNEYNQSVIYSGKILLKKPYYSKWIYEKPVNKVINITKNKLAIIDYDLEQVTITRLANTINFIKLLKKSKKISTKHYKANYLSKKFDIYLKNKKLYKITYKDSTDNQVVLKFTKQKKNNRLPNNIFKYKIPKDYDILKN